MRQRTMVFKFKIGKPDWGGGGEYMAGLTLLTYWSVHKRCLMEEKDQHRVK